MSTQAEYLRSGQARKAPCINRSGLCWCQIHNAAGHPPPTSFPVSPSNSHTYLHRTHLPSITPTRIPSRLITSRYTSVHQLYTSDITFVVPESMMHALRTGRRCCRTRRAPACALHPPHQPPHHRNETERRTVVLGLLLVDKVEALALELAVDERAREARAARRQHPPSQNKAAGAYRSSFASAWLVGLPFSAQCFSYAFAACAPRSARTHTDGRGSAPRRQRRPR